MEPQRRRIESLAGGDVGNVDVEEEAGHRRYHSPLLGIDAHGSAGASAAPACSNSIEMASGVRTNAIWQPRGGRLIVARKSVVEGKRESVRLDVGGLRIIKKKKIEKKR